MPAESPKSSAFTVYFLSFAPPAYCTAFESYSVVPVLDTNDHKSTSPFTSSVPPYVYVSALPQIASAPEIEPSERSCVIIMYGLYCVEFVSALFCKPSGNAITALSPVDVEEFGVLSFTYLPLSKVPPFFLTFICELVHP